MKDDNVVQLFPDKFLRTKEENTSDFYAAARLANVVIPFLVGTGQMTALGADFRLVYQEEVEPFFLSEDVPWRWKRHELTVELRMFGGMVPVTPIGDLEPRPLSLEHLDMFGEACMLRTLEDGSCLSLLLWDRAVAWASHWEGPWVDELLKAIRHRNEAA